MKTLKALPKEKLQKLVLAVIIALVAIGGALNFYVLKNSETLTAEKNRINKLAQDIDDLNRVMKAEVGSAILRDKMKVFVDAQKKRMVDGDFYSWIVREFALFAENQPVRMSSVRTGTITQHPQKANYRMYVTRFEAEGTYDQLGNFVSNLENAFPTGMIRTLSLVSLDPAKGQCRAAIELALLVRPAEPEGAEKKGT